MNVVSSSTCGAVNLAFGELRDGCIISSDLVFVPDVPRYRIAFDLMRCQGLCLRWRQE